MPWTGDARGSSRRAVPSAGALALAVAVACACGGCASVGGFPPFYERESDLPGGLGEERALFGLLSRTTGEDGARLSAIRPLLAHVEDGKGSHKLHVVPPIVREAENPNGDATDVWPLFFDRSFGTREERAAGTSDDDTFLFPLLAWGDEPTQGSYFMAFPFGGKLNQKLMADEVTMVAFPVYTSTKSDGWSSTHLLWPLIAWGEGEGREHFRFLPFWSQTDSANKRSRSLLWPIFHRTVEQRDDRTFDSWFVFPLAGHRTSRDETFDSWTFLYPFFEFSHDDRTGDMHRAVMWPFHKRSVRPGQSESTWWWPAWGNYRSETEDSSFYAWPIVWSADEVKGKTAFWRRYVVPVWMRRGSGPVDGATEEEELRSWPLFSWKKRRDGSEQVRVPEIVPVFGWEAGETVYADLVSLFRWRSDAAGREAWDGPLGVVRWRRGSAGDETLTLLWWIRIPLAEGSR